MKKILALAILAITLLANSSFAGEAKNYVQLRYEAGQTKSGESFSGTNTVLNTRAVKNWSLGGQIVTGVNNFIILVPHIFRNIDHGFSAGGKYLWNSFGQEKIGPTLRWNGKIGPMFSLMDLTQYFDLTGNKHTTDFWWHSSLAQKDWYAGVEICYYKTSGSTENFKLRPLKIGYRFDSGPAPFTMIQRHWVDGQKESDSIMFGCEFNF